MERKTDLTVNLTGTSGNVFALAGTVGAALKRNGYPELAEELYNKLDSCKSYDEALQLSMDYVKVR